MLIRFRKEDGTEFPQWEKKQLNNLLIPIDKTPVDTSLYKKITVGLHKKGVSYNPINREMVDKRPFYIRHSNELIIGKQNYFNGSIAIIPEKFDGCICSNAIMSFTHKDCDIRFLYEQISEPLYLAKRYHLANGTGQKELSEKDFLHFSVELPCLEEQQKIADFLSTVDQKIESQKTIVADYEELKKGTMQKIFNQEVRFKDDDGNEFPEWMEKRLGDVLDISTKSNNGEYSKEEVLSVSDKFGVVNQIKLQGRSFAGDDISKYKVVETDDIIYTKSPLLEKPFGIIKIVKNEVGAVSPLYIVNKAKNGNYPLFIYYYFDSPSRTNNYLKPLIRKGAKNTMNISNEEWLSGKVKIPCFKEQKKIADCLSALDRKIEAEKKILADLEELKKGLLQGIFNN